MKTYIILSIVLAAGIAAAQQGSKATDHSAKAVLPLKLDANLMVAKPEKPNEIVGRKVTYSGVAVQAVKCKEPWQLINPFAPAEYGSGTQNLHRDIIDHKVVGFKLFSVSF